MGYYNRNIQNRTIIRELLVVAWAYVASLVFISVIAKIFHVAQTMQ